MQAPNFLRAAMKNGYTDSSKVRNKIRDLKIAKQNLHGEGDSANADGGECFLQDAGTFLNVGDKQKTDTNHWFSRIVVKVDVQTVAHLVSSREF